MRNGKVKWFNDAKGYGFIKAEKEDDGDIFVHYSQIDCEGYKTLREGEEVEYVLIDHDKGKQAHCVVSLDKLKNRK